MTVKQAKQQYNILLERFDNANIYFDNAKVTQAEKEKQLKNYQVILNGLNTLLSKIVYYEQSEILGGFDIG